MLLLTRESTSTALSADATPLYPFEFFDSTDPFSRYASSHSVEDLEDDSLHSIDRQILECQRYLDMSRAVRTPIEIYALWVEMYEQYGGNLQRRTQAFSSERWWTPTRSSSLPIPTAFGVFGLRLVMVPRFINQDMRPTNADASFGQEYGNGRVHTFDQSIDGKMLIATNDYNVYTYPDVEQVRYSMTTEELTRRAADILRQAYGR